MRGIYQITNALNGKFYIGSSSNCAARKRCHFCKLRSGTHENEHLQNSFRKHGQRAFAFTILEEVSDGNLLERELYYIQALKPHYNVSWLSTTTRGRKLSQHHRERMRRAALLRAERTRGRKMSERQRRQHQRTMNRDEVRAFMSQATKAYYANLTPEQRAARNAHKVGRIFTAKTRAKLAAIRRTRTQPAEVRAKIAASLRAFNAKRLSQPKHSQGGLNPTCKSTSTSARGV